MAQHVVSLAHGSLARGYWELILLTSLLCVIREDAGRLDRCIWKRLQRSQLRGFCLRHDEATGTHLTRWEHVSRECSFAQASLADLVSDNHGIFISSHKSNIISIFPRLSLL